MSGGLFVDFKKGEIAEFRQQLRDPAVDRDRKLKRQVMEKVVGYMTLGINVSELFPEMINATATKDLVQKKMAYLYVSNYAESQAQMALLAINTLQKDCRDEDPMVRGLALRCLCSLKVENIVEYLLDPITKGLKDHSPYVRKTAVTCCVRLYRLSPRLARSAGLKGELVNMLSDRDPQVLANAVCALSDLSGGVMELTKPLVIVLLKRLREMNEWSQCIVLGQLAHYRPESPDDILEIMNFLDERLRHGNSAIVLATTTIFLHLTQDNANMHRAVFDRLKPPLLTLMCCSSPEASYPILLHIKLLAERNPGIFDEDYTNFYPRATDPAYIKQIKLGILVLVANSQNYQFVIEELGSNMGNHEIDFAKGCVHTMGLIACKVDEAAEPVLELLVEMLDMQLDRTASEAAMVAKDVLRKLPQYADRILPVLARRINAIDEEAGKVAVIWCLGEFGSLSLLKDAPYILERVVDTYEEQTASVRMELLTATMKLFFQRAPEVQLMLGRLLQAATNDATNVFVHDRALLYYRLLQTSPDEASRVVQGPRTPISAFTEDIDSETLDQLFEEFNTMSVVFEKHSSRFLKPPPEIEQDDASSAGDAGDIATNDLLSGGAPSIAPVSVTTGGLALSVTPYLDADTFQNAWTQLPVGKVVQQAVGRVPAIVEVQNPLGAACLKILASGEQGGETKIYLYGQEEGSGMVCLAEVVLSAATHALQATVKCEDASSVIPFANHVVGTIRSVSG